MELIQAQAILPFWTACLIVSHFIMSIQHAVVVTTIGVGLVEYFKAARSEDGIAERFMQGLTRIGHRGCLNAPENTVEAIQEAHRLGVLAVEVDVQISADGEPFVFHDSTADRTTEGKGPIESMNWSEIRKLNAAYHLPEQKDAVKVPHLKDLLAECKKLGLKVFLDVKGSQPTAMAKVIRDMLEEFPDLYRWAAVCSFYPQTLYAVKRSTPEMITIVTHRPWVLSTKSAFGPPRNDEMWKRIIAPIADVILDNAVYHFFWYVCGVNAVFREKSVINDEELEYWRVRNITVIVWTVNNPHRKRYLEYLRVPYITDDCSV